MIFQVRSNAWKINPIAPAPKSYNLPAIAFWEPNLPTKTRNCNFWHFRDIICVNGTYQWERGNTCLLIVIVSTFLCRFLVVGSKYSEKACKASGNYPLCILSSLHCVTSSFVVLIVSAHLGAREIFSMPSKTCPLNLNLPTSDTCRWWQFRDRGSLEWKGWIILRDKQVLV